MIIDTQFFKRCILTLERAYDRLQKTDETEIEYEIYRSACIKEFELILEQSGKLLKKCLKPYFHTPRAVDKLVFKEIFRHASHHGLISLEETSRWLNYRDNRNNTAHDYGVKFADQTLVLIPQFIQDAGTLERVIKEENHD